MFQDFKVIELASVLAGPSVGQFFAELGADVIKIENIKTQGDVTRSWRSIGEQTDDRSAYFCSVNWGKRSLALDLSTAEGKNIVHQLTKNADLVIVSYKPGDAEKLNVDYETLSTLNEGLIYAHVTGYGSENPRVGYDAVIQAEAGFMFMNGEPNGPSLKMPVALVDVLAAHHLKEGILLALLEKSKSTKGKYVSVSLIQAAISSLTNQATNYLVANKLPKKQGSAHPNIAPYGDVFKSKDDQEIILAIGSEKQFQDLCSILNLNHLLQNSLFDTNQHRVENREALNTFLTSAIKNFYATELLTKIHQAKIPAGVIQNIKQVFEMREAKELLINSSDLKGVRTFIAKNNINTWQPEHLNTPLSHILPPPHLGEHSQDILLKNLQLSRSDIDNLFKEGVIL